MSEYWIIGGVLLIAFAVLILTNVGSKSLTGRATVVSKRVELAKVAGRRANNWNYLVTFRLSDGEELELYVFERQYNALPEGATGQLTWCKENLSSFDAD